MSALIILLHNALLWNARIHAFGSEKIYYKFY